MTEQGFMPPRHLDPPIERGLRLYGPEGRPLDPTQLDDVAADFDRVRVADPETVRKTSVDYDVEKARLAIDMLVFGSQAAIHQKIPGWLDRVRGSDGPVGYGWVIDH